MMILNVSVSDGVYTNFARLKVELIPANLHTPKFNQDVVKGKPLICPDLTESNKVILYRCGRAGKQNGRTVSYSSKCHRPRFW